MSSLWSLLSCNLVKETPFRAISKLHISVCHEGKHGFYYGGEYGGGTTFTIIYTGLMTLEYTIWFWLHRC
jgi:hypothetical protein